MQYEELARDAEEWAQEHEVQPAVEDALSDLPRRGRRPEHVLHPGLRALRRRPLRHRRRGRQPPALRVHLPQPRRDHEDRPDPGHAPGDAGLPRRSGSSTPTASTRRRTRSISADDVESGAGASTRSWPAASGSTRSTRSATSLHYTRALEASGKYELTIWPYHAMLGGIGHALVPAVEEAIFFHSVARRSQPAFQQKGTSPLTEHYSVLGPGGDARARRRAARRAEHAAARGAARASTRS